MILDKLFMMMSEKQASDIFISAGAPIHIKIQGNTMPVNQQVMDAAMIEKIRKLYPSIGSYRTFKKWMRENDKRVDVDVPRV